jgi:hypothetical protein
MQKNEFQRGLILPLLVSVLGFAAFLRSGGAEHIRTVDMLALLAIGMGLGVALAYVKVMIGMKKQ